MTCLTDVPVALNAQVEPAGAAERPSVVPPAAERPDEVSAADAAGASGTPLAGTASMPSARVPPPTTAKSPADRRARRAAGVVPRVRPAGPFVSLVAAMGDYLRIGAKESKALAMERAGEDHDKTGRISAGGTTRRPISGRAGEGPASACRRRAPPRKSQCHCRETSAKLTFTSVNYLAYGCLLLQTIYPDRNLCER